MALGTRSALSVTLLIALLLFSATPSLAYDNTTISSEDCSTFTTCGDCVAHLQCGFCVKDSKCVPGGWNAPWHDQTLCGTDNKWDYEYGQCFVTHKVVIISLGSALMGVLLLSCMLCVCCCLCRCCRLRGRDDEERPLLGETPATRHFRRASFYNYNRNRPFERRGRTLSSGTTNGTLGSYGRWRDDYVYGSYGTPSVMWVGDNCSPPGPVEYPTVGSTANGVGTGDWRSWEKKREELLAKYDKNNES